MDIKTYISSGVVEAYALGNLSPEEASILECVIKNNKEVQQAVFEMQQTFEKLATAGAMEPPSHLKEEILKKIEFGSEQPGGKIVSIATEKTPVRGNYNIPVWMKAASVAVLFGLGYMGYALNSKNGEMQQISQNNMELSSKVSSLQEMNSILKNSKKIELKGVAKHPDMLAEVYWDESEKVYLDIKNMPNAPTGKQYQLWAIVDGKPVDLGLYDHGKDSTVQPMKTVAKPQAFAITLEKEGGNATPTMEEMIVMGTI